MNKLPRKVIVESFGLTVEAIASVSVQPLRGPSKAPAEPILVRLSLSNVEPMVLEVIAGLRLGRVIAGRLLGVASDDPETEGHSVDALKELVNVTGGALAGLSLAFDDAEPELSCPVSEPFASDACWSAFVNEHDACVLDAEGNTVALRMRRVA